MTTEPPISPDSAPQRTQHAIDAHESSTGSHRSVVRWIVLLVVVVALGGVGIFVAGSRQSHRERTVHDQLKKMGAISVMDGNRGCVASVNLSVLQDKNRLAEAIRELVAVRRLSSLDVSGTAISDGDLSRIARLTSLKSLSLNDCAVTDEGLTHLTTLKQLEALHLVRTKVTSRSLNSVAKMSSLKVLDLSETQVTGGLDALRTIPKLNWLLLRGLQLGDSLRGLDRSTSLTRLNLENSSYDTAALDQLQSKLSGLIIETNGEHEAEDGGNP